MNASRCRSRQFRAGYFGLLSTVLSLACICGSASAGDTPYGENVDAHQLLAQAEQQAKAEHKSVLVVFGANWCPDCRHLDTVLHTKEAAPIMEHLVLAKIDVGQFDKNVDLAREMGVPLRKGIPAAVLVGPDFKPVYVTKAGELADARSMGNDAIVGFFQHLLAEHPGASQ